MSNALSSAEIDALFPGEDKVAGKDFHIFPAVIKTFREDINKKAIISRINKLLSTSTSREMGLKCLNSVMFFCSSEMLAENVSTWVNLGIGQNKGNTSKEMFQFIINIMRLCKDIQDFNKLMVSSHSTYLIKVIEMCISVQKNSVQLGHAMRCLEACLRTYPSTCITMKNKIEQFLLKILNEHVFGGTVLSAGTCYHYLQQIGGAGPDGINHVKNWSSAIDQLCSTMHNLYDRFFEDVNEFGSYDRPSSDAINFPAIPSEFNSTQILSVVENRLKNITLFLRAMLGTKYPVVKIVFPKYLFDVIRRSLSVHVCIAAASNSTAQTHFNVLLIGHQIDSLYLLRSYIAALHSNLIPLSTMITKLLLDCLTKTSADTCFVSNYKQTTYIVLNMWMYLIRNNLNANVQEKLISTILEDIRPIRSDLSLNIASPLKSNSSKAKADKNRLAKISTEKSSLKDYTQSTLDGKQIHCRQALDCLIHLFRNVHISIKPNTLMLVYSTIIKTILRIQSGATVPPYFDWIHEKKLYQVVMAIVDTPNEITPLPLEMAINVFVQGQKNSDYRIVRTCSNGLNILEKICQPVCPSLKFPVLEYECDRQAKINKEKELTETIVVEAVEKNTETEITVLEMNNGGSNGVEVLKEPAVADANTEQAALDSIGINKEAVIQTASPSNEVDVNPDDCVDNNGKTFTQNEMQLTSETDSAMVCTQHTSELDAKDDEEVPRAKKAKLNESISKKENVIDLSEDDEWMSSFVDVVIDY